MNRLNDRFIAGDPKLASLRMAFGDELIDIAQRDERVVALSADLSSSVGLGEFAKQMGDRYIEVGIAEQQLATMASGLARMGKIPFAASYAAFNPGRNWEQIRTTICLNNQPVKIVGSHAGLNVGADGATHQMLEDIALMQALPNMVVLAPGDVIEARMMAKLMTLDDRPNYIRLPRIDLPTYNREDIDLEISKAYTLRRDDDAVITIISTGSMTGNALMASGELFKRGIPSEVIHVPTIKPIDVETILSSCGRTKMTAVIEEHQITGGLGSIVATLLLEAGVIPNKFCRIGVNDRFGQSGTVDELWHEYGLDIDSITNRLLAMFDM